MHATSLSLLHTHRASRAVGVLHFVVAVIPQRAGNGRDEAVRKLLGRVGVGVVLGQARRLQQAGNGVLRDPLRPVLADRVGLQDAVPVHGGDDVQLVDDLHHDLVAQVDLQRGPGELAVDQDGLLLHAVRVDGALLERQLELAHRGLEQLVRGGAQRRVGRRVQVARPDGAPVVETAARVGPGERGLVEAGRRGGQVVGRAEAKLSAARPHGAERAHVRAAHAAGGGLHPLVFGDGRRELGRRGREGGSA